MEVKVSISVIMLTYNREGMISHMIESISNIWQFRVHYCG